MIYRNSHVLDVLTNVGGPKLLARVEVHKGGMIENILGNVSEDPPSLLWVSLHIRPLVFSQFRVWGVKLSILFPRTVHALAIRTLAQFYSQKLIFGVVVEDGGERGRVPSQVVQATKTDPSAGLAVPEVGTAADPESITSATLRASV